MAAGGPTGDDPLIAPAGRDLQRTLTGDEELRLNVHQHPMVLWKPIAIMLGALAVFVIIISGDQLPFLVLVLVFAAAAYLAWKMYERRHNSFAATDRRVLRIDGVINKSVPMMRLQKITDMRLDQPLIGRLFGYGTITIESAGQDQTLRELRYAPNPRQVFRRLNSTIFGEEWAGPDQPITAPPAKRAASAAARSARRAAGATRRRAEQAAERRRPSNSSGPAQSPASPIGDRASQNFFGAGADPSAAPARRRRGKESRANPPVTRRAATSTHRTTAAPPPAAPPASARHTAKSAKRDADTDEIPTLRPPP